MATPHDMIMTLTVALFFGVFFIVLSHKLRLSAITLLLIGGVLIGPEVLGIIDPDNLGSSTLQTIISLAVGLILFEGGLTLDVKGYQSVSREIWGVLTKGVLVTFILTTLGIKFIFGFSWPFCFTASSLIIVTGPTVIGPLLARIRVRKTLHHLLYWEGVLIDPIGVFIALLCFEYMLILGENPNGMGTLTVVVNFFVRFGVGSIMGLISGFLLEQVLIRRWISEKQLNIFVVAWALLTFGMADMVRSETGLLSVTVAGFWIGSRRIPNIRQVVEYKTELKDLLIGLLFVLLAANLEINKFLNIGVPLLVVLALVMFVIRPMNIFISTWRSSLTLREKLFLSWIAPRGIVAASMASLFAINFTDAGIPNADFLEPFTYSVIAGTVIIQALSAKAVGRGLGVLVPKQAGWMIVGAHRLARGVADFLKRRGAPVVIVDTNASRVSYAKSEGLTAFTGNAMEVTPEYHVELYEVGHVLAVTTNEELNRLVCMRWNALLRDVSLYSWVTEPLKDDEAHDHLVLGDQIWQGIEPQMVSNRTGELHVYTGPAADVPQNAVVLVSVMNGLFFPGMPDLEREKMPETTEVECLYYQNDKVKVQTQEMTS